MVNFVDLFFLSVVKFVVEGVWFKIVEVRGFLER